MPKALNTAVTKAVTKVVNTEMTNQMSNSSQATSQPLKKYHSLSRQIITRFCLFTLFLSAIYGMFCFLLLFNLEDGFIEREVLKEAQYLTAEYKKNNQWVEPKSETMKLYFSSDTFPSDMREQYREESRRNEFYGEDGRHYHLFRLSVIGSEFNGVYLIAEVSQLLLVRPMRTGLIKFLSVSGGILVIIAFIVAWLLGRNTVKPLRELAALVDGVEPEQLPDKFAHQFPNNETGILARALEQAMGRINDALEREKCFTRDVSHELRTPVAIIKNSVEVYNTTNPSPAEAKPVIKRIADASMEMEQTVTTLLMLAREEHTSEGHRRFALLPVVEQSIIDHHYLLQDKAVEVQVDDNCHVDLTTNKGMLKVLLDNLISNAFQYTEQGEITVNYQHQRLTVSDTGPGIDEELSTKVIEPHVKGDQSTGYGFGLSIVKRLCDHQGWTLSVESGQGTTIAIDFN